MAISERRQRERQAKQEGILTAAKKIIEVSGVDGLTMREIAKTIEYSPCVIYQLYASKDAILTALFAELCKELISFLTKVPHKGKAEDYVCRLFLADIEFMMKKPWQIELFHSVIGGLQREEYPDAMMQIAILFGKSLEALKYTNLKTKQQINTALDVLRGLLSGVLNMAFLNKGPSSLRHAKMIMEHGVLILLKGWKSIEP